MRKALRTGTFTHFAYLEVDMLLTPEHLTYWCSRREMLRGSGLIPAFVRFESDGSLDFLTDQTTQIDTNAIREVETAGETTQHVVELPIPYQAMYIMDQQLAEDHFAHSPFRSAFRSRLHIWGVRERAAAGPIFTMRDNRPTARTVAPVEWGPDGHPRLHESCLIEHLDAVYARDPTSDLATIPVDLAFGR